MPAILTYYEFVAIYKELLKQYYERSNDIFISLEEWIMYEYEHYCDNPIDYFELFAYLNEE